jgi:hypothetical protein
MEKAKAKIEETLLDKGEEPVTYRIEESDEEDNLDPPFVIAV